MSDALTDDELDRWEEVASETPGILALVAEIRRLRALLTAPPSDEERSAAKTNLIDPLAAAFAVRARKIGDNE